MSLVQLSLKFHCFLFCVCRSENDPSNTTAVNFDPDSFLDKLKSMLSTETGTASSSSDEGEGGMSSGEESEEEEEEVGGAEAEEERRKMEAVMEHMDQELTGTTVADSFEKVSY